MYSVEQIKAIGKERTHESFARLLKIFSSDVPIDIKREAVSSIGRHTDSDKIFDFINREAFNRDNPMELVYQMFRTCLYRSREDERFSQLRQRIIDSYHNENIDKMNAYYNFRQ